ncbi:MAG: hypothetical protein ACKVPY_17525 [Paracoccaceae bacterium]
MRVIVLFNLRPGIGAAEYEAFAAGTDLPAVRALPSVAGFRVHALTGRLFGEGAAPFQYCEVLDIADGDRFGADVSTPAMQAVAAKLQSFADNPLFLTTREVGA